MPNGRINDRGVPSSILFGKSQGSKDNRIRFMKHYAERKQHMEEQQKQLELTGKRSLSAEQKICGARYIG